MYRRHPNFPVILLEDEKRHITDADNEWGIIGQDTFVCVGKSATSNKFESRRGFEQLERLVHSNPHSS